MDEITAGQGTHTDNHAHHNMAAGHFAAGASNWNGIRANLAEMERKLGELQQQVDPSQPRVDAEVTPAHQATPAAHAQVAQVTQGAQVKQQIEDLLRVREMLRESLRRAIGECERALAQLDRGEPLSSVLAVGAGEPLLASAAAPASIVLRPSVFQGSVSLRVGPLADISQVDTLEIALLQVPGAERVEIKEFAGRDAVAQIRLFQPVRLVEELHRVLPFSFEITHGDAGSLTLLANSEPVAVGTVNETPMAAP